eukprot:scaffold4269_cov267-Pinguiococcus_pyrenoidosus.AAC.1
MADVLRLALPVTADVVGIQLLAQLLHLSPPRDVWDTQLEQLVPPLGASLVGGVARLWPVQDPARIAVRHGVQLPGQRALRGRVQRGEDAGPTGAVGLRRAGDGAALALPQLDALEVALPAVCQRHQREVDPHPAVVEIRAALGNFLVRAGRQHVGLRLVAVRGAGHQRRVEHAAALVVHAEEGHAQAGQVFVGHARVEEGRYVRVLLVAQHGGFQQEVGHLEQHLGQLLVTGVALLAEGVNALGEGVHGVEERSLCLLVQHVGFELAGHELLAELPLRPEAQQRRPQRDELHLVRRRPPDAEHGDVRERVLQLRPVARHLVVVRQALGLARAGRQAAEVLRHALVHLHVLLGAADELVEHHALVGLVGEAAQAVHQHGDVAKDAEQLLLLLLLQLVPQEQRGGAPDLGVAKAVARHVDHGEDLAEHRRLLGVHVGGAEVHDARQQRVRRVLLQAKLQEVLEGHAAHLHAQLQRVQHRAQEQRLRAQLRRSQTHALLFGQGQCVRVIEPGGVAADDRLARVQAQRLHGDHGAFAALQLCKRAVQRAGTRLRQAHAGHDEAHARREASG